MARFKPVEADGSYSPTGECVECRAAHGAQTYDGNIINWHLTFSVFPWVTGRRFLDSTNGNRGFESVLLQRRVFWELDFFNAHQAPAAAVVGTRS